MRQQEERLVTDGGRSGGGLAIDLPDRGGDSAAKAVFDRIAAGVGLILLSPVIAAVMIALVLREPGPVLFAHPRIGKGGRPFWCIKFRTMAPEAEQILARHLAEDPDAAEEWDATQKLRDDPRVTVLGRFLRRSSLDELPQLLNILGGEMSVVGPRPIVREEVRHYGAAIDDYIAVRPGLTGLWQVSGRSDVGYRDRVRMDREYVQNRTLRGDLVIIWKTIGVVLRREGSY